MISDAVLVVDKPSGPTSFDVVRKIRRAAGTRRVGHGGTLDPLASGVLPICLGEATKLAPFLLGADKEYEVAICFGVETDTDDADGAVTSHGEATSLTAPAVEAKLALFRGVIQQVPPAYAAIKRDGRPLYDYARAGTPIDVAPREVTIHALELTAFDRPTQVRLSVRCSKGTYVRALARDLGRALGVGGHVTALRRTRSGPFSLAEARPLDDVLSALAAGDVQSLPMVSLAAALGHYPQRAVDDALARDLRTGRKVPWAAATGSSTEPRVCLLDREGELITVAEPRPDGLVRTLRVFAVANGGKSSVKKPSQAANLR